MKKYIAYLGVLFWLTSCGQSAVNLYVNKGKEYYSRHKYPMAIRFLDKALAIDSTNKDAMYYRALCFYGLGHTHQACKDMAKLIDLEYGPADSTLKKMGCYYFPVQADTVDLEDEDLEN